MVNKVSDYSNHSGNSNQYKGKVNTKIVEIGGPPGLEPTRYGDWECRGRVSDF